MSYIDQTLLNNYQSEVVETEMRDTEFGLIDLAKVETPRVPFLSSALRQKIMDHQGITLQVPALTESTLTTSTVESFSIPANLSTSAMTSLSLVTIFCGFAVWPETFVNNVVGLDEYRMNKIKEVDKAMANQLESYIDTHLNTYRTKVWDTGDLAGYNFGAGSTNALDVSYDEQNDVMFSNLLTQSRINEWAKNGNVAANFEIDYVINQYRKYGGANEKNLNFQALPKIFGSNNVSKTTNKRWTAYMVEPGALGLVENYKHAFKKAITVGEAKWGISDAAMPMLGHRVMLYENREKESAVGVGSYADTAIMSWKEEYGYIFRFCLLHKYNSDSDTRTNYILKINGATS